MLSVPALFRSRSRLSFPGSGGSQLDKTARKWVGQPLARFEDDSLVRGQGKYLDDINLDGQLHMRVVRSTAARATVNSIDTSHASQANGVIAVYTAQDFAGMYTPPAPMVGPGVDVRNVMMPLIAERTVSFVGEPVAVVIANSKAQAEDASEMVEVDYEPLPAVVTPRASLNGEELLYEGVENNVLMSLKRESDNFEALMSQAARVVEGSFELPRLVAAPMEPRGCLVSCDNNTGKVTLWASSQDPHRPRAQLSHMFGIAPELIRVIVPEVGGAFGSKGGSPQEYLLAYASSKKLGYPIKWVEDRSENFTSSYQGRGISAVVRLGIDGEGRFLAIEADLLADLGAYLFPSTTVAPVTAASLMTGAYRIPGARVTLKGVATNKVPTGPYRGAGRPEACYFVERIVEMAAQETGLDPLEIRMRNILLPEEFPYRTPLGQTYDSGNYAPALERVTELLGRTGNGDASSTGEGWVSATGFAMSVEPAGAGFWESGSVEVAGNGTVIAKSGSSAHGQGHKTSFAQIIADELGVDIELISVKQGDSDYGPGVGTFGSRSMLLGGEALVLASREVKAMAADWAATQLEASKEDLVWEGDTIHVQGSPEPNLTLFEIARQMEESGAGLKLESKTRSDIPGASFPFGAYGAEVAIDVSTGNVKLKRVIAVDDAGTIINPLLAEGQIVGGTLQGVASALWEEMVYNEDGLPVTASFLDYLVPSTAESDFDSENEFTSTPTPYTALGAKGVGESGTVGALAAVANAVNACLGKLGFEGHLDPPYSPQKIWNSVGSVSKQ